MGVNLDNKLEWSSNTEVCYRTGLSRFYFLIGPDSSMPAIRCS